MTSNLGTRDIQKGCRYRVRGQRERRGHLREDAGRVTEELKKSFRPEFINRIDEVIVFRSLTQDDVKKIVDLMMRRVREQLKAKDVEIELTEAAKILLATQGYDQSLGRTAAAPHHPASGRGPARREAPVQGVPCRRDDLRRRGGRRDRVRTRRWRSPARHASRGTCWFARVGEPRIPARPRGDIKAEARPHMGTGLLGIWDELPGLPGIDRGAVRAPGGVAARPEEPHLARGDRQDRDLVPAEGDMGSVGRPRGRRCLRFPA